MTDKTFFNQHTIKVKHNNRMFAVKTDDCVLSKTAAESIEKSKKYIETELEKTELEWTEICFDNSIDATTAAKTKAI
jgi:ABC-type phosphate/phosphonate transport system substrate-binding protein